MKGNPLVRVYRPVYEVYRTVARKNGISLSDLVSTILLRVALESPSLVKVVLREDFGMDYSDAWDAAEDLEYLMREKIREAWEKTKEEIEKIDKAEVEKVA